MSLSIINNLSLNNKYHQRTYPLKLNTTNTVKCAFSQSKLMTKSDFTSPHAYLKQLNLNNNIAFKSSSISNYLKSFLNKDVIGYEDEKDKITEILLDPFIESYRNKSQDVPASILLYGPEKNVMESFVSGISDMLEAMDNVQIINFSQLSPDDFIAILEKGLKEAKKYNEKTGRRSIFYLSNPEKILGMTYNQAKRLMDFTYNDDEINILKSNERCIDYVPYFKSLLDSCSKSAESGGYGLTFLLSTDSPHLIHPDLRKGKMEKIEIPRLDDNKSGLTFFYLLYDDSNKLINTLKNNPENVNIINKIENLGIDKLDDERGALILEFCRSNPELGAYSYKDLDNIVRNIFKRILSEENDEPEMSILANELLSTKRSYPYEEIIRQDKISGTVSNKNT